ncbi:MAG: CCA tRNA nucleotidyltransferase [Bdellovibrionales bacterium]|nr:CCA tRNA nucleotidyltransferase [Bdellovibrionales bacterium]
MRDSLLGQAPLDFDIATIAPLDRLEVLFPEALSVGKQFGIIILPYSGFQIEVASFRKDGVYLDGRRPSSVTLASAREDAFRRDFTINALFYDWTNNRIIDFVEGRKDLDKRILRTVGDPEARFSEDKLRLIRALRIAAQVDFEIERRTFCAIRKLANEISLVSPERLSSELRRILGLDHRLRALHDLVNSGLAAALLPELNYLAQRSQFWARKGRLMAKVMGSETRIGLLWALLVWPEAMSRGILKIPSSRWVEWTKIEFEAFFRRLRFSRDEMSEALFVLSHVSQLVSLKSGDNSKSAEEKLTREGLKVNKEHSLNREEARLLLLINERHGISLLDFCRVIEVVWGAREAGVIDLHHQFVQRIQKDGHLEKPWVTGRDLLELGFQSGPSLGVVLEQLYLGQIAGLFRNRADALEEAKREYVQRDP